MEVFAQQREQESSRIREDIARSRQDIKRLARELYSELKNTENAILGKLRPLSLEDIRPFLEDELGYDEEGVGYKLHTEIKLMVGGYFDQATAMTQNLAQEIASQLDSGESFIDSVSGDAFKVAGKAIGGISKVSPEAIKVTIFAARDMLAKVSGFAFKFKPWEATKLAGSVSKWAGPAGAAFTLGSDIYSLHKKHELEQGLLKAKSEIGDIVKDCFKGLYEILGDDEKLFCYFAPQLKEFEKMVEDLDLKSTQIRSSQERIIKIKADLEKIVPLV